MVVWEHKGKDLMLSDETETALWRRGHLIGGNRKGKENH